MVADRVATMHGEIDGPAKLLRPLLSSSRSLDGRIKADDDVGSWEKGLILARSILTAVKEEREYVSSRFRESFHVAFAEIRASFFGYLVEGTSPIIGEMYRVNLKIVSISRIPSRVYFVEWKKKYK